MPGVVKLIPTGTKFERLTVVELVEVKNGISRYSVECSCGTRRVINRSSLTSGKSRSCGCLRREQMQTGNNRRTHGQAGSGLYHIFYQARSRCTNRQNKDFAAYGGRGIEFRFQSFEEFHAAIGDRPSPDMTVERVDNSGHYEKGNIVWATKRDQALNRRPKAMAKAA